MGDRRYLVMEGPLELRLCVLESVDDTLYLVGYHNPTFTEMAEPNARQIACAESQGILYATREAVLVKAAR